MFRVEEREGYGKMLVATQNLLPGSEVLREMEPLLMVPKERLEKYRNVSQDEGTRGVYAAFSVFLNSTSSEKQLKYLRLYGPTVGGAADSFRSFARDTSMRNEKGELAPMSADNQELFVKIANVYRLNCFETGEDAKVVYEFACRMLHSCLSNCERRFEGNGIIIRAIVPIQAGDVLSIEYNPTRTLAATAERRHKNLEFKSFTCHCPRCDAPGDDTRQFDCFDPTCHGRHYACQPLSDKPLSFSDARYTGVEYVEPYLLPCTTCERPPSVEYQARMLAEEKRWEGLIERAQDAVDSGRAATDTMQSLLQALEDLTLPRWHSFVVRRGSLYASLVELLFTRRVDLSRFLLPGGKPWEFAEQAARVAEEILRFPNPHTLQALRHAARVCLMQRTLDAQGVEYCRNAVRMQLLCNGRETRDVLMERLLVPMLDTASKAGAVDVTHGCCAFCEESPERAAMKLSLCGRCRKVSYCSVDCQTAHWPVHKRMCKKA
jgi:hypothetical protein